MGTSSYTPQYLWDVIIFPSPWYPLVAHGYSNISLSGRMGHILTHWGRVTHTCVGHLTIIGSDNGLSPGRHQAITWTNVGILLIGPLGTNFSEMLTEIHTFSLKKIHFKISSGKWRPFCLGLIVLNSHLSAHSWRWTCLLGAFSIEWRGYKGTTLYKFTQTHSIFFLPFIIPQQQRMKHRQNRNIIAATNKPHPTRNTDTSNPAYW